MADASWPVQQAVYTALTDGSPPAVEQSVYDGAAPAGAVYPYVVIGEATIVDDGTKTEDGQQHTVTLHVWDRPADAGGPIGYKRTKEIMAAIRAALHDVDLSITGHATVMSRVEMQETFLDEDGITRHGVLRLRVVTQPA